MGLRGVSSVVGRPRKEELQILRDGISNMQVDDLYICKPINISVRNLQQTALLHINSVEGKFKVIAEERRAGNKRVFLPKMYILRLE